MFAAKFDRAAMIRRFADLRLAARAGRLKALESRIEGDDTRIEHEVSGRVPASSVKRVQVVVACVRHARHRARRPATVTKAGLEEPQQTSLKQPAGCEPSACQNPTCGSEKSQAETNQRKPFARSGRDRLSAGTTRFQRFDGLMACATESVSHDNTYRRPLELLRSSIVSGATQFRRTCRPGAEPLGGPDHDRTGWRPFCGFPFEEKTLHAIFPAVVATL